MRELSHGAPYVRPKSSVPAGMWPVYCDGYYTGICAALRNMRWALDDRKARRRAQIRAAAAARKVKRSAELGIEHVGEKIRVSIDQVVQAVPHDGHSVQRKHEFHGTIVVRDTHRNPEGTRFSVEDEITFHVDQRGNVGHAAQYPAAPNVTQQKN